MKLNQVIAIEKSVKSKAYAEVTELHKTCQKPDLFNGFTKTYERINDDSESLPPETKKVQFEVSGVITQVAVALTDLFDVTAQKDYANCTARATVTVGTEEIVKDAPVTFLLFLEKQLNDVRTFIEKLPVLDDTDDWKLDENSGFFKTDATKTHRTKKAQKPIVLYEATKEHPAQTQIITEDILVGYWNQVKVSGALPKPQQHVFLQRVDQLQKAVKVAREAANDTVVVEQPVGVKVFKFLFS